MPPLLSPPDLRLFRTDKTIIISTYLMYTLTRITCMYGGKKRSLEV